MARADPRGRGERPRQGEAVQRSRPTVTRTRVGDVCRRSVGTPPGSDNGADVNYHVVGVRLVTAERLVVSSSSASFKQSDDRRLAGTERVVGERRRHPHAERL